MRTSRRTPTPDLDADTLPRVRDVAHLDSTQRRRRKAVLEWCVAGGTKIDADALTLVLRMTEGGPGAPRPWTVERIQDLVWLEANDWCAAHEVERPFLFAQTLHAYLGFLSAHRSLPPGSEPIRVLKASLQSHFGPRRAMLHPSGGLGRVLELRPGDRPVA